MTQTLDLIQSAQTPREFHEACETMIDLRHGEFLNETGKPTQRGDIDLGPLDDPSPSESALSLLRSACNIIGIEWPTQEGTLAIIIAERLASAKAIEHRAAMRLSDASKCDSVSLACYWIISAILSARYEDDASQAQERRHAARAVEHLDWVSRHG